ncbi:MAG: class I SAM-dependent methyltransferase [Polyangiales bacterium]
MKLYDQLADWYTLLTPLAEYAEEAAHYRAALRGALGPGRHSLLELGAGAGHNAHHLAADFDLTLTDLSPRMLDLARASCPGATFALGDMRSLRLGRTFDAVFAHDALCYMLTEGDLRATFETARAHLRPGGVFVAAPDHVAETFAPGEDTGGSDGGGRSLRYLEWAWQRAGERDRYVVDYAIVTRVGEGPAEVHHDRHEEGLFPRATWAALMEAAGFSVERAGWAHSEVERELELFVARAR